MRVTNQMMSASLMANLNQLRSRQASLQDQISSGDRISNVSEDPSSGAEVMRTQSRTHMLKQWGDSLADAKDWVNNTESKLGEITDILNQAKELALQGSNGSMSTESQQALAPGADQILQNLLAALNDKEPNGALFGGFQTDGQPFAIDQTTGAVTYTGDSGDMKRDVGPGITMVANVNGNRLAPQTAAGWSDPNNMLTAVWNLVQGLKSGNTNQIAATMSTLDSARQSTVALRAEMGARQVRVEQLDTRQKDMQVQLADNLQQAQGVDIAKAIMDLNSAETTYRAALQVGGQILPQTLADFIR